MITSKTTLTFPFLAQQLLDGWLKEKSFSQTQNEMEFQHESWNQRKPTRSTKTGKSYFESILHEAEIQDEATAAYSNFYVF